MEAQRDLESYRERIGELEQDNTELKTKFGDLHEENDRLRKSLQEILESIRNQDANSDVKIHSESLEAVLSMLDARHLWGASYHPAMGLKAKIERLEGANMGERKIDISTEFLDVHNITYDQSCVTN